MNKVIPFLGFWILAGSMAGAGVTVLSAVDGGGARARSANYVADQSLGGIVGVSTVYAPPETIRQGYIGQLTDMTGFSVQAETNGVEEGGSQTLGGVATLDDGTRLAVAGADVAWDAAVFPLASLSESGLATTTNVYEDTPALASGRYLGLPGTGGFLVRDGKPDDFGSYAGDGLPDGWQVGHFGFDNPDAGPTNNVDEDPFDNTEEWISDTIPTDGDSYFQILGLANAAPGMAVAFESSSARRYSLETTTDLSAPAWVPIAGQTNISGNDGLSWLSTPNAFGTVYYRVVVRMP